jgi:hypothetical protein
MNIQKIKEKLAIHEYKQKVYESKLKDTESTLKLAIGCMALSLNNEYGFGRKRTNRLISRMTKDMICIAEDHITKEDMFEWCRTKGINL